MQRGECFIAKLAATTRGAWRRWCRPPIERWRDTRARACAAQPTVAKFLCVSRSPAVTLDARVSDTLHVIPSSRSPSLRHQCSFAFSFSQTGVPVRRAIDRLAYDSCASQLSSGRLVRLADPSRAQATLKDRGLLKELRLIAMLAGRGTTD